MSEGKFDERPYPPDREIAEFLRRNDRWPAERAEAEAYATLQANVTRFRPAIAASLVAAGLSNDAGSVDEIEVLVVEDLIHKASNPSYSVKSWRGLVLTIIRRRVADQLRVPAKNRQPSVLPTKEHGLQDAERRVLKDEFRKQLRTLLDNSVVVLAEEFPGYFRKEPQLAIECFRYWYFEEESAEVSERALARFLSETRGGSSDTWRRRVSGWSVVLGRLIRVIAESPLAQVVEDLSGKGRGLYSRLGFRAEDEDGERRRGAARDGVDEIVVKKNEV